MTMIDINKGSMWRRWDLHFHTPSSYDYVNKDVSNKEIVEELRKHKIAAVAITDHNVIDNERITELTNLAGDAITIFPGIEICTDSRGTDPIHITGIFPEDSDIEYIWKQLEVESTISEQLKSGKSHEEVYCPLPKASETIRNLGGIVTIHAGRKSNSIECITNSLPVKMAEKKDIANHVDIFELGQKRDVKDYKDIVFKSIKKKYPLILCSDNHDVKNYTFKQKLWIKADPTFEGLMQIIYEPVSRVFIGEKPHIISSLEENPRRYIKMIVIDSNKGYDGRYGTWFSKEQIDLSPELVAIIGNKGSGKSAITDILGLLGNSHNQFYKTSSGKTEELFSFLNKDKFLKGNYASNFEGVLHWYDGNPNTAKLDQSVNENAPDNVEYLPQKYLEKICSNIEDDEFRQKLNEVIFNYVKEKDRYGYDNLNDLINYLTLQTKEDIVDLKDTLHQENESVINLETKLTSDYFNNIEEKIKLITEELEVHKKTKPPTMPKPKKDQVTIAKTSEKLSKIENDLTRIKEEITTLKVEQTKLTKNYEDIRQAKEAIERQKSSITKLEEEYSQLFSEAGFDFKNIITFKVNLAKIDTHLRKVEGRLVELGMILSSKDEISLMDLSNSDKIKYTKKSLVCKKHNLEVIKKDIIENLDKPNQKYQEYTKKITEWKNKKLDLLGEKDNPKANTLNWLKQELLRIKSVYPTKLEEQREKRNRASKAIFTKVKTLTDFYDSVKTSIDKEIKKYGAELGDYNITIESSLRIKINFFIEDFFRYINQAVKGSFYGSDDGKAALLKLIRSVDDWEKETQVFSWLDQLVERIDEDFRSDIAKDNIKRNIFKQMKQQMNPVDFYDFIFGFDYLQTKYDLKVDKKDLSELSPGERGGLLLIFYLMLDKRNIPLIIDQPEDNLDNKSVYQILVKFLKRAKKRRQIIMATHNPNLAVVADAEQLIHVEIDKKNGNDFSFDLGSIENPVLNSLAVDILEGTMPAFDNRKLKYRKQT